MISPGRGAAGLICWSLCSHFCWWGWARSLIWFDQRLLRRFLRARRAFFGALLARAGHRSEDVAGDGGEQRGHLVAVEAIDERQRYRDDDDVGDGDEAHHRAALEQINQRRQLAVAREDHRHGDP